MEGRKPLYFPTRVAQCGYKWLINPWVPTKIMKGRRKYCQDISISERSSDIYSACLYDILICLINSSPWVNTSDIAYKVELWSDFKIYWVLHKSPLLFPSHFFSPLAQFWVPMSQRENALAPWATPSLHYQWEGHWRCVWQVCIFSQEGWVM